MLSLNIQIKSMDFAKGIFHDKDTLRVSVTTLPGEQKQNFKFEAKKLHEVNPYFSVIVNENTEKIVIVFRKKNFSENNPIFASTVLQKSDFPKSMISEIKTIKIYEPKQQVPNSKPRKSGERKILGQMEMALSLTEVKVCNINALKCNTSKKRNSKGFLKINRIQEDQNDSIFNNLVSN